MFLQETGNLHQGHAGSFLIGLQEHQQGDTSDGKFGEVPSLSVSWKCGNLFQVDAATVSGEQMTRVENVS